MEDVAADLDHALPETDGNVFAPPYLRRKGTAGTRSVQVSK
jgi:hypothetical protein